MNQSPAARTTWVALLFEGALGVAALGVGWLLSHVPTVGMAGESGSHASPLAAVGWGLVATLPMFAALLLLDWLPLAPLQRLQEIAHDLIAGMFAGASVLQLAIVSLAAGFGEELLFRGLVQAGLSGWIGGSYGPWIALLAASVAFGVCHWVNATYAFLAMLAGAWFGLLLVWTDSLWTPIVAHAAYDFVALIYLVRPNHLVRSPVESVDPPPAL
jgi:membrane protease YdiL (CAAX protease family)